MEIRATRIQVEDFLESILWKDIKHELLMWRKGFKQEMETIVESAANENPSTASVLLHMGDINGRLKAVDYVLEIPNIFIQLLDEKADEKNREATDGT